MRPFPPPGAAVVNWRAGATEGPRTTEEAEIPSRARIFLAVVGIGSVLARVTIFLVPRIAADNGPWKFTPLTARALSAYIAFTGLFLLTRPARPPLGVRSDRGGGPSRSASP